MNRGPATLATAVALALINLGLATLIVNVITGGFAPVWFGGIVLVLGIGAAVAAVALWRQYLAVARRGSSGLRRSTREVQGE